MEPTRVNQSRQLILGLGSLLLVGSTVAISLYLVRPPAVLPDNIPATQFSASRAMKHLRIIADKPHPVGSAEHARVRDYLIRELVQLGLTPEVQQGSGTNVWSGSPVVLHNIVARMKGTESDKAVMVLCHYDSVPGGPGAADDGAGLSAVVETVRALRAGPALRNDLIVLITDGEEGGLLGARVFVKEHPWLDDVGLVLNFEARGNGGPVLLMQTGRENGWLIREFAKAAPYPFASSFAEDVFKRMPNDTDFTIFRSAGKTGLNFAFFKGLRYYHTDQDTLANLDPRSLQHHGSYCLSLARHFGNLHLDDTRDQDRVFFNILGTVLVHYPLSWDTPITVLSALTFLGAIVWGFGRRRLTWTGTIVGFLALIGTLAAAPALVSLIWWSISKPLILRGLVSRGDVANADLYSMAFASFTIAVFAAVHAMLPGRIGMPDRTAGALVLWLVLSVLSCVFVPRGNYLFAWPLLFSAIGLAAMLPMEDISLDSTWWLLVSFACALPGILIMTPGIYLISITVGTSQSAVTAVCTVAFLGLLTPLVQLMLMPRRWLFPAAAAMIGVGFLTAALTVH